MNLHFTTHDVLETGVAEIIGEDELKKALRKDVPLRIKLGIDPTSPNVHLGRSIPLWRLRAFQELGHEIHLIIGDFTGQIGDTSDKEAERPMLTVDTIQYNLSHYLEQVWMILNPERKDQVHIHYNSEWLNGLTLSTLSHLTDAFSVNSFVKRELIARRLEAGSRVSLREMLYPVMQGYDSVMIEADVEIGGTDQRFNLLAGRDLQEQAGQKPQAIIMNKLIAGTDGRKMSSSWGNVISLRDTPTDKFGKVMSISDGLMEDYLSVLPISARPFTETKLEERLAAGENPRDLKLELAERIVEIYHGADVAKQTRDGFIAQFSKGAEPEEMAEFALGSGEMGVLDLIKKIGFAPSTSDARRLVEQGGLKVDGAVITDISTVIAYFPGQVIQAGKRRFVRIREA